MKRVDCGLPKAGGHGTDRSPNFTVPCSHVFPPGFTSVPENEARRVTRDGRLRRSIRKRRRAPGQRRVTWLQHVVRALRVPTLQVRSSGSNGLRKLATQFKALQVRVAETPGLRLHETRVTVVYQTSTGYWMSIQISSIEESARLTEIERWAFSLSRFCEAEMGRR